MRRDVDGEKPQKHSLRKTRSRQGAEPCTSGANAAQDRRDALSLLGRVVVLAAAAWVLFTQVFLLTQASGNSMFPAVKDGDLLIAYRLQALTPRTTWCSMSRTASSGWAVSWAARTTSSHWTIRER